MATGITVFRCGEAEHRMALSVRDLRLLDGRHFLRPAANYRAMLGLDFLRGMTPPPTGVALVSHLRPELLRLARLLLAQLEEQRDLLSYSYSYEFSVEGVRHGGAESGFRIGGLIGMITVKPSGYCDLTLSELDAGGRPRVVEVVDMRVQKTIETDDRGTLKVHRRNGTPAGTTAALVGERKRAGNPAWSPRGSPAQRFIVAFPAPRCPAPWRCRPRAG